MERDINHGNYSATSTVSSERVNLWERGPDGGLRHLGTLVSTSKSKLPEFEADVDRIVRSLDLSDKAPTVATPTDAVLP